MATVDRTIAQREVDRITPLLAGLRASLAAETQRGNMAGADAVRARLLQLNAERAAWFKVLNDTELTDTDRRILALGNAVTTTATTIGKGAESVAGVIGKTVASALGPLVPILVIAAIAYFFIFTRGGSRKEW